MRRLINKVASKTLLQEICKAPALTILDSLQEASEVNHYLQYLVRCIVNRSSSCSTGQDSGTPANDSRRSLAELDGQGDRYLADRMRGAEVTNELL